MIVSDDDILFNAVFDAWRATLPNEEFEPDRSLADAGVDWLKAMELIYASSGRSTARYLMPC